MNYHKYYPVDVVNGLGTRCTLFVSGCVHQCKGCYNQSTQRLDSGHPFTEELADRIVRDLNDTRIKRRGLSLSGGDPLHPQNLESVLALVTRVRQACPDKDIWCWTGYRIDELDDAQLELLPYLDVLIDGRFDQELADPALLWRGSSNQVVHRLSQRARDTVPAV